MWPFKKTEPKPVVVREGSPCGDDELHFSWTLDQHMTCPKCFALKRHAEKRRELTALAEEVVKIMEIRGLVLKQDRTLH